MKREGAACYSGTWDVNPGDTAGFESCGVVTGYYYGAVTPPDNAYTCFGKPSGC